MAKVSTVWCIYNKQNILMTVSTSEVDAWLNLIQGPSELSEYFQLVAQGYYAEQGEVVGK